MARPSRKAGSGSAEKRKGEPGQRTAKAPNENGPAPSGRNVRVRMYRHGLGDCFLISLLQPAGSQFHIMIDCGVILGTPDAHARLECVIDNIIKDTGGRVDVLVVTHEHYDHVAGFALCKERFAAGGERQAGKLAVGEVWFAWTERPGDELADRLRQQRRRRKEMLAAVVRRLDGIGFGGDAADGVLEPLRFFGVGPSGAEEGDVAKAGGTAAAMANASSFAAKVTYWEPGQSWQSDAVPGVRIYVLGPPRDELAFRKTDSTTETYHLDAKLLEDAVGTAVGTDESGADLYSPFDRGHCRSLSVMAAGKDPGSTATFLKEHYLGFGDLYPEADLNWRRIDGAWLGSAEQLGLALDSATNNTSLALAIELVDSGTVLLFPADAQVGNWLSWHSLRWENDGRTVTAADLLARTRFYKVGHHGSHNATLKMKGLEMMPTSGLVAFIPVDERMANTKRWFEMPLAHLVEALRERCGDAVVRIDRDLTTAAAGLSSGGPGGPFGSLYHEWVQAL